MTSFTEELEFILDKDENEADCSERRRNMKAHKVICGFSGVGKSTAEQKNRSIYDLESSGWSWDFKHDPPTRKPDFPANYIDNLERMMEDLPCSAFLLSCHAEVRRELQNRGIPYIIVMPRPQLKNEYLKRWLRRGSDMEFIEHMNDAWDDMISSCQEDSAPIIYLDSDEYISDLLCL